MPTITPKAAAIITAAATALIVAVLAAPAMSEAPNTVSGRQVENYLTHHFYENVPWSLDAVTVRRANCERTDPGAIVFRCKLRLNVPHGSDAPTKMKVERYVQIAGQNPLEVRYL